MHVLSSASWQTITTTGDTVDAKVSLGSIKLDDEHIFIFGGSHSKSCFKLNTKTNGVTKEQDVDEECNMKELPAPFYDH